MSLLRSFVFAIFFGVMKTHGSADSKEWMDQVVDAPFGKVYVSVLQHQSDQRLLFYVVISKLIDTPAIPSEDVTVVVLDQDGKVIKSKPLAPEYGPLIEATGAGASANKVYQLTLVDGQQAASATVMWLGHKMEFKSIEWWH